ncbi:MAG: TetR/AcrR family transcriptional regulator [Acidobacteria bacterium]|uniref:TetR/AcrR family transcriptional regulator n=1 Tax=Candidatus Sulfomarinibacter kjeldsenii TaxID=2885994 RepID=A0A8J6YCJ2_9BACT|nr:TetR/AcrR family transcriptional regulator [Candidatus Sulfomarinibacter kjeldsenii]
MPESEKSRELTSREQKRNRILRAAIEVFASKGYFAARMTDVASEAKVADGTLYLYFEGKEHLLMSIFDDVLGRFIERLDTEIAAIEDPIEKLSVMIRLHLETVGRDHALANVLQIETRHSRRFMSLFTRGKLGEYLNRVRDIIVEGQELGAFRGDISPGLATNLVFGAVDELVTSWLLADRPGDLLRHHRPLVRMLTDGIAPCRHHGGKQL